MGIKYEVERKFVIRELPPDFELGRGFKLDQGYICAHSEGEVRLRGVDGKYFMTIKSGCGLKRVEAELELSAAQFAELWPFTAGRRIEKTRHRVHISGHQAEIDVFQGCLAPLILAEVEFDDVESSRDFVPPAFFAVEVTDDPAYRNAALVQRGGVNG